MHIFQHCLLCGHGVAVLVFSRHVVIEGLPCSDVAPAELHRIYPRPVGLLHDTVVDGNVRAVCERSCYELVLDLRSDGHLPSHEEVGHLRQMSFHLALDGRGLPYEDTGIPEELACADEKACHLLVRLLGECLHCCRPAAFISLSSSCCLYISIVGVRPCRNDSEGHQDIVFLYILECLADGLCEEIFVIDDVV